MADEPVVVTNPQPVKAGNRPEDKTEGTLHHVAAKSLYVCEGAKINQSMQLMNRAVG